jgi:hypothetical protein
MRKALPHSTISGSSRSTKGKEGDGIKADILQHLSSKSQNMVKFHNNFLWFFAPPFLYLGSLLLKI